MNWLVDKLFQEGLRGIDAAPEGGTKTIFGCWFSVCVAAGALLFGCAVKAGPVLIIDGETPEKVLDTLLDRFSQGLGFKSYGELPILTLPKSEFRFGRKTELEKVLNIIGYHKPVLIRLDSYIAMLPGGRQSLSENNSESGIAVRDDLNRMLQASPGCSILLAAHSGKPVVNWSLEQIDQAEMQQLVRGHGSLVGEACDTGFCLKKLSEYPDPLRCAIITKSRRGAVPMSSEVVYVEMKEEAYGQGWARLDRIAPVSAPPSDTAKAHFSLFKDGKEYSAADIMRLSALRTKGENRAGIEELLREKVILNHQKPFCYVLNPKLESEVKPEYLNKLKGEAKQA